MTGSNDNLSISEGNMDFTTPLITSDSYDIMDTNYQTQNTDYVGET